MKFALLLIFIFLLKLPTTVGKTASQATDGFVIVEIQPGSIYEKLGFKKGDILKSYNGKPIQGKTGIKRLLKKLFETPGFLKLKIERSGKTEEFTYNIELNK